MVLLKSNRKSHALYRMVTLRMTSSDPSRPKLVRSRFVYDSYRTMEATRSRHGWVHMFITHCPTVTLQLHNFDLFRTCRTGSFCTVAWQLARLQLTRRPITGRWGTRHPWQHVFSDIDAQLDAGQSPNFAEIFGVRKLESLSYRMVLFFCDPTFSRFSRTPTCDRHRQTQTQAHGQYRGCIA